MRRITILLLVLGLFFIGGVREAKADFAIGSVGFGGAFFPVPLGPLGDADGINVIANVAVVTVVSGDFDTFLNFTDLVTYNDFTFNPSTAVAGLWTGGGFTFNLAGSVIVSQTDTGVVLSGSGTVTGNGFDPTPAAWSFSGDRTTNTFAFSSTTSTEPPVVTPEPTSLLLLGIGLLTGGLGVARQNRRARK